ncbi:MAG: right-handed parallel beta-helix repeat-containing protein [Cyanobacterium sp.]
MGDRTLMGQIIKIIINNRNKLFFLTIFCILSGRNNPIQALETRQNYQIIVNSNLDGDINPDQHLTLREAIALINNTLTLEELSELEQTQVEILPDEEVSRIHFNLDNTTITLEGLLPPIANPVIIDGTTNQGYNPDISPLEQQNIPQPVVTLTRNLENPIFRGLTLSSSDITIRGLNIYGFRANNQVNNRLNLVTPAGNIVITHQLHPENFNQELSNYERTRRNRIDQTFEDPLGYSYDFRDRMPSENIVIENNWIGFNPHQGLNSVNSAFGVYIFNGNNTRVENNYISGHLGSGIITGKNAQHSLISNNLIRGNGNQGVPDAIRLEGDISNSRISNNTIVENQGSGIYLFRTKGSITIEDNEIMGNGLQEIRGAIYVMGSGHRLENNRIFDHNGPGVVVTAYPQSMANIITNNRFGGLNGLSIDLVTRNQAGIHDYQKGDGINPPRNSKNRRQDTAHGAINAPQFLAPYFYKIGETTAIDGMADPFSVITLYRVDEDGLYGPLSEPIAEVMADEEGRFQASLPLQVGQVISAIALLPEYGTSEPSRNAEIRALP